jgi:hypothetical protein
VAFAWSCARWMQVMVPHLRSLTSWFGSSPMIRVDPSRSESIRKHMPTQLVSGDQLDRRNWRLVASDLAQAKRGTETGLEMA